MHDLDRTQLEGLGEDLQVGPENFEFADDSEAEAEIFDSDETGSPFGDAEEMELAADLLEVTDDYELDQFLGKLIKRAARKVRRVVRSPIGRAVGGLVKGAVRKALPVVGRTLGTAIGGPAGGALGSRLAPWAGRFFGFELEGLSPEDQEFEVARRLVRLGGAATQKAVLTPSSVPPETAARSAVAAAAKRHAPGLMRTEGFISRASGVGSGGGGRWIRRGGRIILFGV